MTTGGTADPHWSRPSNPRMAEAHDAANLARRIFPPAIAHVVSEALRFMGNYSWVGDQQKLIQLIEEVRAEANRRVSTDQPNNEAA